MIQIIFWKIYNAFLNKKKEIGYSKKNQQLFSFFEKYEQKLVLLTLMDLIHTNIMHFFILFEFSVLLPTKSNFHFLIKDTKKFV